MNDYEMLPRPHIIGDLTLVTAIDRKYVTRLQHTWPTWMRLRPWLASVPAIVIYDARWKFSDNDLGFLHGHKNLKLVPWKLEEAANQREKMLTSLVHIPALQVETSWYLKLDADSYATKWMVWLRDEWFAPGDNGVCPAYVASPWRYTKPADAIARLDDWGDQIDGLRIRPRLNLPVRPGSQIVRHERMASWVFFGSTSWTRRVASFAPQRLPCPSQDTYLCYCAARLGSEVRLTRMAQYGWAHAASLSRLKTACELSKSAFLDANV